MYSLSFDTKIEAIGSIYDLTINIGSEELSKNDRLIDLELLKKLQFHSAEKQFEKVIYNVTQILYKLMCDEYGHSGFYADINIILKVDNRTKYEYNFNRKGIRSLK